MKNLFTEIDIYRRGTTAPTLEGFKSWLNSKYRLELEVNQLKSAWESYRTIFLGWH